MDIRNFFGPRSTAKKSKPEEKTKSTSKDEVKVKTKEDTVKAKEKSKDRHRSKSKDEEKSKGRRKSSTENEDNNNIREKEKRKTKEIEDSSPKKKVNERKHKKDDVPKEKTPKKSEEVNGNRHSHSKRKAEQVSSDEDIDIQVTKKARKSKKMKPSNIIYDSDSDEESPVKEKKKKKRDIVVLSDSDEDDHIKKEKTIEQAFSKVTTPKQSASKKRPHEEEKKKTPISAADFFGAATVKRTDSKSSAKKKQIPQEVHEDMEIHDDSDFEDTLRNLDDHDFKAKKVKREETRVEEKVVQTSSNSGSSFASKLAGRLKGNVPETPDKKTSPQKSPAKVTAIHETPQTKTKSKQSTTPPAKSPAKVTPKKTPPVTTEKKVTPEKGASTSPDDKTPLQRSKSSYRAYLHREGPKALGSKEIPQGADNCLEGLTFVITGVLESVERDEAKTLVERYGGKVTGSISKKTSYIVIGRDPGESKTKKAEGFGTKVLDEDGLFNLIRTLPGKRSKYEIAAEAEVKKELKKKTESKTPVKKTSVSTPKKEESLAVLEKFKAKPAGSPRTNSQGSQSSSSSQKTVSPKKKESQSGESLLWVDKYKPQSLKNIIGQQGDKSCAKKLLHWLNNWHRNRAAGKKPVFNKFNDDGSGHKAALLSGPPGVGKTTTATLVCKEAGYSFVELNASDTRSKKSLETTVSEALNNHTLVDYMGGKSGSKEGQKHCLVMDEVDGMAGNEDRGGVQELIALIKNSKIPIICMCNDRQHQKIRSLANYCFDLRFQRPRVEQIKAAMMSIAYREGLKLPPNALNEIIGAANQDVRQVIHNLSMWSAQETSLTYEQLKADAKKAKKDMKLGPFDVCRKVFVGGEETAGMSIHDKTELFFHDYSIGPLFVQENYPFVTPYAARGDIKKHLDLLSRTADSLAQADIFEKSIRGGSNWSLLPVEAIFATVYPGDTMRGSIGQMINFPSWLGKNSTRSKNDRILQELKAHMRLNMCGDKRALNMDYLPHMKHSLTRPLIRLGQEGVPEVIQIMDEYDLVREDVDNILEVSKWPNEKDLMSLIDSKVKSAFTRTYNKEVHMTPYSTSQVAKKGKRGAAAATYEGLDELGEEGTQAAQSDQEDDDDDVTADAMIKQKKPGKKGKTEAPKKGKAAAQGKGQSKGQGKGKGRGKK